MKVKVEHLKARRKITLYIPKEEQAFIEEIVRSQKGKSFSRLVIEALKEKFKVKKVDTLFGSLGRYKKIISEKEALSKTLEMVAENAAKEGLSN
ncbi:MAG: hypothetical protein JRI44_11230 [Deltaproteobacteria bacterium]|nr:hypothetical protein [Deltaproteobacteria bacterium]